MRSQWGERRSVFLYVVDLKIGKLTLPGVYVVGDELGDETVLGRNVLNELRLLLDWPASPAHGPGPLKPSISPPAAWQTWTTPTFVSAARQP